MYLRVQTYRALGELIDPFEGTLTGSLLGNAEIYLFLNDKLGGGRHRVTYRTEEPPAGIDLYPYDRVATQVFKLMDGPTKVAAGAKGKWVRFDVDVGWLFWLRVVNGRTELKLAAGTRATFGDILRHLQQPGLASVSLELADAPGASTSEGRVFFWLLKNIGGIVATEQQLSIDRRAIAGAIAWETLRNPYAGRPSELATSAGVARFSGPGKVHYKDHKPPHPNPEGNPVARQVEQLGRLPVQTMESRRQILATTSGALLYIGTIMREFSNAGALGGYYLDCDPPMLTTFFNASWTIARATEFFQNERKAPTPLMPGPDMGSWVQANMGLIERMVGKPPAGFCRMPRGY